MGVDWYTYRGMGSKRDIGKRMKVIFIVKDFQIEPLGIGYLSAILRKQGYPTTIIKTSKESVLGAIKREFQGHRRIVLAYSITTGSQRYYLEINHIIKRLYPKVISIFGGPHVTYFPDIAKEWGINHIIRGEADIALPRLLRDIEMGNKPPKDYGLGELVKDLDTIPFPDRELLYKYPENRDNPIKNVLCSRGCPYNCPYCYNMLYRQIYKGEKLLRWRSARNIVDECKELKRWNTKLIYFEDDEFLNNPNFNELMDLYRKEVSIPFHCQIRIERLDLAKVLELKEAGCTGVTFAIESGNEEFRKKVLKRHVTNKEIKNGVRLLNYYKIKFRTENMCGLPEEHWYDILDTIRLNVDLKPCVPWMSIFQPYPRLPLGEQCLASGIWDGDIDAFNPDFFTKTVLKLKHARKVNNIQKFFSLVVRYPILYPLIELLILIPENRWYKKFYEWHKKRRYRVLYGL